MTFQAFSNRKKEILFFVLLLIIFYRSPYILLHGRFMAEEGSKYFANAKQFSSKGISKQTWTVQISRGFSSMCLGRFSNFQNILFLGKLKCFKICVF